MNKTRPTDKENPPGRVTTLEGAQYWHRSIRRVHGTLFVSIPAPICAELKMRQRGVVKVWLAGTTICMRVVEVENAPILGGVL
jgi:hypothetical protein